MTQVISITEDVVTLIEAGTQGPPGPAGIQGPVGPSSGTGAEYTASTTLSGHRMLAVDQDGEAVHASADVPAHAFALVGLSLGAAVGGAPVTALLAGDVQFEGWSWIPDQPVFLGLGGALTQTIPPSAAFAVVVGQALSATRVMLRLQSPIFIS